MIYQPPDEDAILRRVSWVFETIGAALVVLWVMSIAFDWFPPSSFVIDYRGGYGAKKNLIWTWGRLQKPNTLPSGSISFNQPQTEWRSFSHGLRGSGVFGEPRIAFEVTGPIRLRVTLTIRRQTCATQEFDVPADVTREIYVYCPPLSGATR